MRIRTVSLTLALIVAGCTGGEGGDTGTTTGGDTTAIAGGGAEASIVIADFAFSGPETIDVGTTVTVTNEDGLSHTWTSDDDVFDSGSLGSGATFEFTFDEPGEYPFFCKIHPTQMTGSITVEG